MSRRIMLAAGAALGCWILLAGCRPIEVPLSANETPLAYGIAPYRGTPPESTTRTGSTSAVTIAPATPSLAKGTADQAPGPDAGSACTNDLQYMGDLTYPDRTIVAPGERMDKQWKVRNSGSCDWGPAYQFRFAGGTPLAERDAFALFPARAGNEAVLSAVFIAPAIPGEYISRWQAVSPSGAAFGQTLFIDVIVRE